MLLKINKLSTIVIVTSKILQKYFSHNSCIKDIYYYLCFMETIYRLTPKGIIALSLEDIVSGDWDKAVEITEAINEYLIDYLSKEKKCIAVSDGELAFAKITLVDPPQ